MRTVSRKAKAAVTLVMVALLLVVVGSGSAQAQAVNPLSTTDLITQVNTLAAGCSAGCTIHIPAGDYTVRTGTIRLNRNGLSLVGDGPNNTTIHYAGANFLDVRLPDPEFSKSFAGGVGVRGFTLECSNPQAHCITTGSVIGGRWEDLTLIGPACVTGDKGTPGTSEGFTIQNSNHWMERTIFRNVTTGGFATSFHFMAPREAGTDSYGYMLFDGLFTNVGAGSRFMAVDAGALVYNVLGFSMQFNSSRTTTRDQVFAIAGQFNGVGFHVTGENSGAPVTFAHIACGGRLNFEGDYNIFGGGIETECAQSKTHPFVAFRVTPFAGLEGVRYALAGLPVIQNADALGQIPAQPLSVWALQQFQSENPTAGAYNGFAGTQNGRFSPLTVFDPAVPWCLATRGDYTQPNQISYRTCIDGAGDLTTTGALKATTVETTRRTPVNAHEACKPGESWDDDNFHYHCTSAGAIKRMALQAF